MCFRVTKTSGRGAPPDPRTTSARPREAARHGPHPEARLEPDGAAAAPRPPRPVLARRCRTDGWPAGRRTGPPPPRSGARHPSGTDCWLGVPPNPEGLVRVRSRARFPTPGPAPLESLPVHRSFLEESLRPMKHPLRGGPPSVEASLRCVVIYHPWSYCPGHVLVVCPRACCDQTTE